MINGDRLLFSINGHEVPVEDVNEWEFKRLKKNFKFFQKHTDAEISPQVSQWIANKDIQSLNAELVRIKIDMGFDRLRRVLERRCQIGDTISGIAAKFARGKRKFSITEIYVPHSNLSPEEVMDKITEVMMVRSDAHDAINVGSNPDHYVLLGLTPTIQEVLETTGGSPLPTHFYAHYGDLTGLQSRKSTDYSVELAGAAKDKKGHVIGGMRHQVKKENDGFRFKALVEFPGILPDSMIKAHQYHLACEFGHWITAILDDVE
ncbi:hypothetical protein [Staphylococcus debuckii]|uniref:hypothetical protein n=1 Tax=Staphylococcus debuckii TaxID=2044912 RepID=UPI000F42E2C9|nr:hypothetical protein [Staphylococcus debuckii]AYU54284.1 hypothetical protein CNQ82_02035 [Staphylococcus debuckii]